MKNCASSAPPTMYQPSGDSVEFAGGAGEFVMVSASPCKARGVDRAAPDTDGFGTTLFAVSRRRRRDPFAPDCSGRAETKSNASPRSNSPLHERSAAARAA